jgi:cell division protein FtsN
LSFNDGLLINLVSTQEGIDITEATARVSDYVSAIKQKLDDEGKYIIPQIGQFTRDKSGILRFEQNPDIADLFEDEDLDPEGDDSALLDLDHSDQENPETSDPIEDDPTPSLEEVEDELLLTLDPNEAGSETNQKPTEAESKQPSKAVIPPPLKEKAPIIPDKKAPKGTLLPPWAIALLILIPILIVALYFLFWNRPSSEKNLTQKTPIADTLKQEVATDTTNLPVADLESIKKAENTSDQAATTTSSAKEKKPVQAVVPQKPYHIIVGSFKSESNAQKMANSLRGKGFENATKIENKGMYVVSVLTFNTLSQAQKAQEELMARDKMESWILLRK